ncbi:hypothetical protein COLO4_28702 [Corchorus olitorius]|uniref:Uncharacterized protein n=1 Tax=Corchorus olitorius TaxID=93759 RepID=A0A1R3HIP7_9ROSI|nr:hypothetical protein COLO4_28702 [Corchorus olitorius]
MARSDSHNTQNSFTSLRISRPKPKTSQTPIKRLYPKLKYHKLAARKTLTPVKHTVNT